VALIDDCLYVTRSKRIDETIRSLTVRKPDLAVQIDQVLHYMSIVIDFLKEGQAWPTHGTGAQ
jgi:hypothetical protein